MTFLGLYNAKNKLLAYLAARGKVPNLKINSEQTFITNICCIMFFVETQVNNPCVRDKYIADACTTVNKRLVL